MSDRPSAPDATSPTSPTAPRTALIYTRVSGPGQEKDGTSLEGQEAACRALAAQRGYTVVGVVREVYRGSELFDRPQMTQVRAELRARRYGALIVWTTDRLARNPVHQAIIIEEAMRGGAVVEIVNEPLDTSPEGLLIAYVRGYAAQIDRERIRARTLFGRRRRLESGRIHNVGIDLYGYRRDRDAGVRVVYEPEALIVRRIYDWCVVEHRGIKTIARMLNEQGIPPPNVGKRERRVDRAHLSPRWYPSTVRNILRNPAYRGETVVWRLRSVLVTDDAPITITADDAQNGTSDTPTRRRRTRRDPHAPPRRSQYQSQPRPPEEHLRLPDGVTPALVSDDLWYSAQVTLNERIAQRAAQVTRLPYLLAGLMRCGVCGRTMEAQTLYDHRRPHTPPRRRYRCASRQALDGACGGQPVTADALEAWVWDEVRAILRDADVLQREAQAAQASARAGGGHRGRGGRAGGESPQALADERARTQAALARVERLQARTLARYNTVDDEAILPWSLVQAELARLDTERTLHEGRLVELEAALHALAHAAAHQASIRAQVAELARHLDDANTHDERRRLLEQLNVRLVGNGALWSLYLEIIAADGELLGIVRRHIPPPPPAQESDGDGSGDEAEVVY